MEISILINNSKRKKSQSLDLSNKNLSSIPMDIYDLTKLIFLDLSNNKISEVHDNISNLVLLTSLNISHNPIRNLPIEICEMKSLEKINLKETPIGEFINGESALWKRELKEYTLNRRADNQKESEEKKGGKIKISMSQIKNLISNKENKKERNVNRCNDTDNVTETMENKSKVNLNNDQACFNSNTIINSDNASKSNKDIGNCHISLINNQNNSKYFNINENTDKPQQTIEFERIVNENEELIRKLVFLQEENEELKKRISTNETNQNKNVSPLISVSKQPASTSLLSIEKEKVNNNKRNWMDMENLDINNSTLYSKNQSHSQSNHEESLLLKEQQQVKRLKSEIERLNEMIKSQNINRIGLQSKINIDEIDYSSIEIKEKIGEGGFAFIHKAVWIGQDVAVKVIFNPQISQDLLDEFNNEINMLSLLRHPNIISIIGVSSKPKLLLMTEYAEKGSLFEYLHRRNIDKSLSISTKLNIIIEICKGLAYLEYKSIVHRDIKSHNILITNDNSIKICDFGLSKFKSNLDKGSGIYAGTASYMAPEMFNKEIYDSKVDVFAFGTLVWEILNVKIPFDGFDALQIKNYVIEGKEIPFIIKTIPNELILLTKSMREFDSKKRPCFSSILKSLYEIRKNI